MLTIVPDFTVMSAVKYKHSSFVNADKCRQAFESACSIAIKCDAKLILAEQILQELGFNSEQKIALETLAEFDKTTIGAKGQTPQNCVVETAKTWLLKKVIVIDGGQIKVEHESHHNLKVLNAQEFISQYELATILKDFLGNSMDLDRIMTSVFFKDGAGNDFEELKRLIDSVVKK